MRVPLNPAVAPWRGPESKTAPANFQPHPSATRARRWPGAWLAILAFTAECAAQTQPGASSAPAARYLAPLARTNNQSALRTFALPAGLWGANATVLVRTEGAWKLHGATEISGAKVKIPDGLSAVVAEPMLRQTLTQAGGSGRFVLNDGRQSREMRYEFFAGPDPAVWEPSSGVFTTEVRVAVFPKVGDTGPLAPLPVEVAGVNAEVNPSQFVFTNAGKYQVIRVTTKVNDEEASVNLAPFTKNAPFVIPVRRLGGLKLTSSALRIRGYGLGTATLTATRVDTKSKDLAEGPKLALHATSDRMRLAQNLSIPSGQSSVAIPVRSAGLGANRVLIATGSDAARPASLALDCYFPSAYLLATLLGGLIGACARFLEGKARRRERIPRFVFEGVVAAFLATAAVLAGAASNLLPATVCDTELGAFLISAAVSFSGIASVLFLKKLAPQSSLTSPGKSG
jgi:hypothetical protein